MDEGGEDALGLHVAAHGDADEQGAGAIALFAGGGEVLDSEG